MVARAGTSQRNVWEVNVCGFLSLFGRDGTSPLPPPLLSRFSTFFHFWFSMLSFLKHVLLCQFLFYLLSVPTPTIKMVAIFSVDAYTLIDIHFFNQLFCYSLGFFIFSDLWVFQVDSLSFKISLQKSICLYICQSISSSVKLSFNRSDYSVLIKSFNKHMQTQMHSFRMLYSYSGACMKVFLKGSIALMPIPIAFLITLCSAMICITVQTVCMLIWNDTEFIIYALYPHWKLVSLNNPTDALNGSIPYCTNKYTNNDA